MLARQPAGYLGFIFAWHSSSQVPKTDFLHHIYISKDLCKTVGGEKQTKDNAYWFSEYTPYNDIMFLGHVFVLIKQP